MLKAFWDWLWPKDAPTTSKRHTERYITHEQLELALAEATKELTYEWNEWYEKFNALHLRLSKRDKRRLAVNNVAEPEIEDSPPVSVLTYRRMTSP